MTAPGPGVVAAARAWMRDETARAALEVTPIRLDESTQWYLDSAGTLAHRSGRFFRVVGVEHPPSGRARGAARPIIHQPEVGTLGFLVVQDEQGWWVMAQAKVEPGNVLGAQLAPTVQATKSNSEAAHGGRPVPYFEETQDGAAVLFDQLQSEHNGRFLRKRNRNCVLRLEGRCDPADASFRWLPLGDLLPLLREDNLVNTDARSVLACWLLTHPEVLAGTAAAGSRQQEVLDALGAPLDEARQVELEAWLGDLDRRYLVAPREVALVDLEPEWRWRDGCFEDPQDPTLLVRQVAVRCRTREVPAWDQPLLGSRVVGRCAVVIGRIGGALQLLLQARAEAGNLAGFEVTTTIQADAPGDMTEAEAALWRLVEAEERSLLEFETSEEGGRFDHCVTRYRIAWTDHAAELPVGAFHRWVPLAQVAAWARQPNRLTNELRSALSALFALRG